MKDADMAKIRRVDNLAAANYVSSGDGLLKSKPDKYIAPRGNQIFIDIDTKEQYAVFSDRLDFIDQFFDVSIKYVVSKSGLPHRHVIIDFNYEFSVPEKLFLQSFLGSDPTRDVLSFVQYLSGDANPILLETNNG